MELLVADIRWTKLYISIRPDVWIEVGSQT
jgi:hypothetical protein